MIPFVRMLRRRTVALVSVAVLSALPLGCIEDRKVAVRVGEPQVIGQAVALGHLSRRR